MTDQTTPLRDRIAEAALTAVEAALGDTLVPAARAEALAGIAAVLPAPADQAADLAAALAEDLRYVLDYRGPGHAHERPGFWDTSGRPCMHCARLAVARMNLADHDAELRRMADETATTETQAGAPGRRQTVEYFVQSQQPDGTWESASSFSTDLDFAAARLAARREKMPDLTLRLAERTTTVAVRALPDCLSCRHWSCDGTGECGALLDAWQRCDCTGPAAGARQDKERPRCPHCQMPHDLTPDSFPARTCAGVRQRIAEAARLHTEGEHRLCTPSDCDTAAGARQDGARP